MHPPRHAIKKAERKLMPARDFLDNFPFDPTTFNFDKFKAALAAEIDGDTELSTAALTEAVTERDTLKGESTTLKARLFDATIARQGAPVRPDDSPAAPAGNQANPATAVKESDIFEKVEL